MAGVILVLTAAVLAFEWIQTSSASTESGLRSCHGDPYGSACGEALNSFMERFLGTSVTVRYFLIALPALLAVFIAAPLLTREIEHGTHQLVWTQSITRMRWFTIKVGLLAVFTVIAATAVTVVAAWWHQPLDQMYASGQWMFFEVTGPVPIAYAVFALALGIAVGTVILRTVPAMAATLFLFVATRFAIQSWRPWFLPPMSKQLPADTASLRGALEMFSPAANAGGVVLYHPAERFWTFQAIESAIFFVLAVLLIALSAWWLRHRIH
jgi:hypothetical protein